MTAGARVAVLQHARLDDTQQDSENDGAAAAVEGPPLSKTASKRLQRQERAREVTRLKRIAKKQDKKALSAQRREETAKFLEQLPAGEHAKLQEAAKARREARVLHAEHQKQKVKDAMETGMKVVIDLDFEDKMTEKEIRSLCQQLAYCYSVNSKAVAPVHLLFTGLGGETRETLARQSTGYCRWAVTVKEDSVEAVFGQEKDRLVYLSADATDTLQVLDPAKVYVIGGIVDRNRHKGLCQARAARMGVASAKLPIDEHVKLAGTRVLTVNQVHAIMVHWLVSGDWGDAVNAVVPTRKKAATEQPSSLAAASAEGQAAEDTAICDQEEAEEELQETQESMREPADPCRETAEAAAT